VNELNTDNIYFYIAKFAGTAAYDNQSSVKIKREGRVGATVVNVPVDGLFCCFW